MQPPTFSGGTNLKPEAILSFLGMVENLFKGELLEKDKTRDVYFLLREQAHLWWICIKADKKKANKGLVETRSNFKKLFLECFLSHDHIHNMKEWLKALRQGTMSIPEYKDRFDKLVEYFLDLSDQDKQIFFVTRLQSSIKYDVKALKPYMLGKTYSMALTFEAKNVELAKEKKFLFDVPSKDYSNEKNEK